MTTLEHNTQDIQDIQDKTDTDTVFDMLMQEADVHSLEGTRLLDELSAQNKTSEESVVESDWDTVEEITPSKARRFDKGIAQARKRDARDARGRWFAGGRCLLDRPVAESRAVRLMLEKVGPKPKWAVVACVTLRAQGKCEVCEEQLHGSWDAKLVVPTRRGGVWMDSNCLCVCQHCAKCWYTQKDFHTGTGLADDLRWLSVEVMKRRQRTYKDCKMLSTEAWERFKVMEKEQHMKRVSDVEHYRALVEQARLGEGGDELTNRSLNESFPTGRTGT